MNLPAPTEPLATTRTRPLVWIKSLVLVKSIEPWDEIRKIDFTTGLNIIQGESNEADENFQSGHGIGKTTVCRLIRYCLGEKSFGQKHVIEEVTHCFPDGYAGAEFELNGSLWSVLLPLGKHTKRFAQEGIALRDLVRAEGTKNYDVFTARLSEVVFANVPVTESLTGGQTLSWLHVLAMCSRDQESRYDRHWNWRVKRSESGTPVFSKPKVDAGLCLRAVLSLLDPNETILRTRLEELDSMSEQFREGIRKLRELPTARIADLRQRLESEFSVANAVSAPLDDGFLGLDAAVNIRQSELQEKLALIEETLTPLNRQISITAASLLEPEELAKEIELSAEKTIEGTDNLLNRLDELRRVRQLLRDADAARCWYGQVRIGDCNYVRSRTEQMDKVIFQQQLTVIPIVSEREEAAARLADQARPMRSLVEQIQQILEKMGRDRDGLIENRQNFRYQHERISTILAEIHKWNEVLEGRKPNSELQLLEQSLINNTSEINTSKERLTTLIADQMNRANQLNARFDSLVKKTLTSDFRGVVDINEDGVNFRIVRGGSLSGEAYETLAILLADLSLLLESAGDHVHHPGLLIHDSPREADLNVRLFERMLETAFALMQDDQGNIPYQYIVTTTTLPSQQLQTSEVTKMILSSGSGSLFAMQLDVGAGEEQKSLFDAMEDQ